ncbi:unnamed protein product [Phytophthora lilii]|uniref:Unnamed protein product n=1 Tax=Phytophthora lilii TaxID=2077276 RepID=A0A9W6WNW3_9STRA|nr:unnamed protein product [Phytophthora lilii]
MLQEVKNSRVVSVQLLADKYRQLLALPTPQELASALYLTAGQLAPPYEGVQLRFGAKSFVRFLRQLETDREEDVDEMQKLEKVLATYPDYGRATQALLEAGRIVLPEMEERGEPLSIQTVHEQLLAIAKDEGVGGVARKQQMTLRLLQQCSVSPYDDPSGNYDNPVSPSHEKEWIDCVTLAFAQHPNYYVLAQSVHTNQHDIGTDRKIDRLRDEACPAAGVPVLTMSAYPVSSVATVLDRMAKSTGRTATCEYKYDGARVQVHLSMPDSCRDDRSVRRIFSRNMEDVTERFASLLDVLQQRVVARNLEKQGSSQVSSIIVEGEVVALDRVTGTFRPFQVLQTKSTTEFCLFLFDLLAVDGVNLLQVGRHLVSDGSYSNAACLSSVQKSLRERRALLHDLIDEESGYVEFVKHIDVDLTSNGSFATDGDVAAPNAKYAVVVRKCLEEAVSGGCEGLMVKLLDGVESGYKAGRRSYSWMKLKHDYLTDESPTSSSSLKQNAFTSGGNGTFLADTLDLVPIGAFYGKGRRAGVFGSFLMATYNSASGKFETIGKVGTGFSDAQLEEVAGRLKKQVLPDGDEVPGQYQSQAIRSRHPDVWLSPEEVWEIKATQLTESPSYTCGALDADVDNAEATPRKGLALRFPRFVRFRPDKKPLQATDSQQVLEFFEQQQQQISH